MNFIFFGTDEFSVKVLETLDRAGWQPTLIITAPDKPQGRKLALTPPPVKVWAEKKNIPVAQPLSLKNPTTLEELQTEGRKAEFALVASYGQIIPSPILDLPTHGTLNLHPSLLPKYRGPSPLETAILDGVDDTGVTIIKLDAEMDHGPILAQAKIKLADQYNFVDLRDNLAILGAELLLKKLPAYLAGKEALVPQDHSAATYTHKFTKVNGRLDPTAPATENYRKILALNPWPGTYLETDGGRLIIKIAHLEDGALIYDRVVPAGRPEMSWTDFLRGFTKK